MLPFSFFDAHCDTLSCCTHLGWNMADSPGHTDLRRGAEFAHYAQVFAIFHDGAKPPIDGMLAECGRQAQMFRTQLALNEDKMMQCRTAEDLERAAAEHKTAAMLSVEGAELLECDPGRLDFASELGVKLINLTWNRANALSGSNLEERGWGLSEQGKAFVKRAQSLDILMDVSHLSDPGFWDLMDITEKPVVASHSNSRSLCGHSRNLTDEQFLAICSCGGYAGINLCPAFLTEHGKPDYETIYAHMDHFLQLGSGHVALGGDLDGISSLPAGITGVHDYEKLASFLEQKGLPEAAIQNIYSNTMKKVVTLCTM